MQTLLLSPVLLGTWLGGLCQLSNTQELKALESLFNQAITIFLKEIKKGGI
ncbi:TetR family transcriptional regulator C-terminal domain-containing protein [Lysinibacillus xylanilyticus]|uniref:TetR family transcriptional regulator C-terminal domain-containing protein n=1 Tax=Lysinibacillus xylanilyticus TaxID=582475 RepID=UPI003B8A7AD5